MCAAYWKMLGMSIVREYGGQPQDLVFTSGGTEADTTAIHTMSPGRRLVISAIEHDAVRSAAVGADVVPVRPNGVVDLAALEARLADGVASLVCLMLANNETGVIQPVAEAAMICRRHGALLHVDAIQAAGRIPVRLDLLGAHSLAISSHKLGGPAGVGALLLAPDVPFTAPLMGGGGQERGRRGGTQAVALAAGFAAAVRAGEADDLGHLRRAPRCWPNAPPWRVVRWCAAIRTGGCRTPRVSPSPGARRRAFR